ncbi:MAG: pitrilysin family protein [Eubacteriales bacterium]|nr:pitrilysin family protein [Eubacteriales bacterium]MDY3333081.1 pitrilysin family protein [Gallibacter sp.]
MIKIRELSSGIKVILDKTDYVSSVAIGFWVKTGSVNEDSKYAGISHFVEHMLFKGTENRSAHDIARDADNLGCNLNAFTSRETTCYHLKTLSENLIPSTEILIDMLVNSRFDKKEMTRERKVIMEEIKMTKDVPDEDVQDTIFKLVHSANSYGKSIIGTNTSLRNITQEVMKNYVRDRYTKDNILIAIAGKFDEDEIIEYLEGKMDSLKDSVETDDLRVGEYKPSYSSKIKDIEQSHFFLGKPAISLDDDRYYAYAVANSILGGSMSSRLFQSVREQQGLAYSVYSLISSGSFVGGVYIYAGVAHESIEKAVLAICAELRKFEDSLTQDDVNKAKTQLKSSFIFGRESVAARMYSLGRNMTLLNKVKTEEDVLNAIDKVSLEDVKEVARELANIKDYSAACVSTRKINWKKLLK